jgi:hypothetical protein
MVEGLLHDVLHEEGRFSVSIESIQKRVAEHFDIRLADMTSKRRPECIAFPRQIAMFLSRQLTEGSLSVDRGSLWRQGSRNGSPRLQAGERQDGSRPERAPGRHFSGEAAATLAANGRARVLIWRAAKPLTGRLRTGQSPDRCGSPWAHQKYRVYKKRPGFWGAVRGLLRGSTRMLSLRTTSASASAKASWWAFSVRMARVKRRR